MLAVFYFLLCFCCSAYASLATNATIANVAPQFIFAFTNASSSNQTTVYIQGYNLLNISAITVGPTNTPCYKTTNNYNLQIDECVMKYTRNDACAILQNQYPHSFENLACSLNQNPCTNITSNAPCTYLNGTNNLCYNLACYDNFIGYCLSFYYTSSNDFAPTNGFVGVECDANTACSENLQCVPKAPPDKCLNHIQCMLPLANAGVNALTIVFDDGSSLTTTVNNSIVAFQSPVVTFMQDMAISPGTPFTVTYTPPLPSLNADVYSYECVDTTGQNQPFVINATETGLFPPLLFVSTSTVPLGTPIAYPHITCQAVLTYEPYGFVSTMPSNGTISFDFLPLPQLYSVCPNQILSEIPSTVIIQGDDFVPTQTLKCILDNNIVSDAVFVSPKSVSCTLIYSNRSSPAVVNLTLTNDGQSTAKTPLTINIIGACSKIKPNSIASGSSCICTQGYEDVNGAYCQKCADGFYQPNQNQQSCIPCDATETTNGALGSVSSSACVCKDGLYKEYANQTGCSTCPYGLDCSLAASNNYTVLAGFWRAKVDSTVILRCAGGASQCPAGNGGYGNQLCARGYKGPLCSICKRGYGSIGGACLKCPDKGLNSFLLLLLIIVTLTLVYILIKSTTRQEEKNQTLGVTVKVLVSYMQVLYYVGKTSAHWSNESSRFFQALIPVTLSPSFLSIQCATNFGFYRNITLMMVLPLIIVVAVALVHLFLYYYENSKREDAYFFLDCLNDNSKVTLVLLALVHPTISQDVIRSFKCTSVEGTGTSYMTDDMRVDCSSHSYHAYVVVAALYVVFYIAGFVAWVISRLVELKDDVVMVNNGMYILNARVYVFFVRGYKTDYYLWEFMILFRKIAIVIINSLFPEPIQLVWAILVIGFSLAFTVQAHPYRSVLVNSLDLIALTSLLFTVLLGLHSRLLGSPNQHAIFALLVIVNTLTTMLIIAAAFNSFKPKIIELMQKVNHYLDMKRLKRREFTDPTHGIAMTSRSDILKQKNMERVEQINNQNISDGWQTEGEVEL